MDLPIEVRFMVYEELMDRHVRVAIPGLDLPGCVLCRSTQVLACFHPAMLRVNKQLATEYAAIAMPHMILSTSWATCDHGTPHDEVQGSQAQPPILPETALANMR